MKPKDVLVFYPSGKRIDWEATKDKLFKVVLEEQPNELPASQAMTFGDYLLDLKKMVKKYGVQALYQASLIPDEKEQSDELAKYRNQVP